MKSIWFVAGTAAGVYVASRTRRAAEALTVDGVHDRLTGWFAGARLLREEVRIGMAEKETELLSRLALEVDSGDEARNVRRLPSGRSHELTGKGQD